VKSDWAPRSLESWSFVQKVLVDMTETVKKDAETEAELLEGLRVITRVTALCTELSVDADPDLPFFFNMCTPSRQIGGPNPDGGYYLAMIRGDRAYRVSGTRGTTAYLGLQVLAGVGMTPRRMGAYVSDHDLKLNAGGTFSLLFSAAEPAAVELDGAQWVPIPDDSSSIVVREYIGDAATEELATLTIEPVGKVPAPHRLSDTELAEQFTSMAWTIVKLSTLHRTIKPELLTAPNMLMTAQAAELGAADTTPDNLYMIGTFAISPEESLILEFKPPETRYWNVTLENIWHECLEPRLRHSSVTHKGVQPDADGLIRIAIGARDTGRGHWLDTGGRHRGFVVLRWLDNPEPPDVAVRVVGRDARR
jgi:hypothetical protein